MVSIWNYPNLYNPLRIENEGRPMTLVKYWTTKSQTYTEEEMKILLHTPLHTHLSLFNAFYLAADVDQVVDKLEGGLASISDCLNTELRENYGAAFQVGKYEDPEAIKTGIKKLVDCIKSAHKADLARVTAERDKAQNEIANIRMWEVQREPDCSDIKECKPQNLEEAIATLAERVKELEEYSRLLESGLSSHEARETIWPTR